MYKNYLSKSITTGFIAILAALSSVSAYADAQQNLQMRLAKVNVFNADFAQKVFDKENTLLQESNGKLWVKRPNLFKWHTESPDESILVSDGETLWFYNPFIEQVTASSLSEVTKDTPFMLISNNSNDDWKRYTITQRANDFVLKAKDSQNSLKQFDIRVTPAGVIESFKSLEQDGQQSEYVLSKQNKDSIDATTFTFTIPKGVELDDQRKK